MPIIQPGRNSNQWDEQKGMKIDNNEQVMPPPPAPKKKGMNAEFSLCMIKRWDLNQNGDVAVSTLQYYVNIR